MRQWVSLFLLGWLPCFLMAAQANALQMQIDSLTHAQPIALHVTTVSATMTEMPCHHTQSNDAEPRLHTSPDAPTACKTCGFCLLVSHLADTAMSVVLPTVQTETTPRFDATLFSSRFTPPAIKPPIHP